MELDSHSELELQVSTADPLDFVFVTLFRTAVERANCRVHKLLRTSLTLIVLAVADGLFGLYGLEHRDKLFIGPLPPPVPCP